MKMRSLLFAVLAGTLILSCQKQPGAPEVRFSQEDLSLESGAVQGAVEMMANRSWTASTNAPWCRVYPNSGNGFEGAFGTIHILCEENLTPLQRSCDVTVTAGSVSRSIRITQGHREGVMVPEKEFNLGPEERTLTIQLWRTTSYTALADGPDSEWISIVQTKAMDEGSLTVHLAENTSIARSGCIRLRYDGGEEILQFRQTCGFVKFEDKAFEKSLWWVDQDGDGRISVDEARAVKSSISIPAETKSAAGLEQFINLEELVCFAPLSSLNIDPLVRLRMLSVHAGIKQLACSKCSALQSIRLYGTALPSLYLAGCTSLTSLEVSQDSKLSDLYFGSLRNFSSLHVDGCSGLKSLNLSGMPSLSDIWLCNLEHLERLSLQQLTGLKKFVCSTNPALAEFSIEDCPSLQEFTLAGTAVRALVLPDLAQLTSLGCSSCELDVFSVGNCPALEYLNLSNSKLNGLDLSFCPNLTFLECNFSRLGGLDLSPCPHITQVYAEEAALTSLAARDNRELTLLSCSHNQLEEVSITGCTALTQLALYDNQLTKLQIPDGDSLYEVNIGKNPLTELDTGGWPRLYNLNCEWTHLTSLDFTQNRDLQLVYALNNPQLKTIYLIAGKDYWRIDKDPETELVYR